MKKILLGSHSPRRIELLNEMGIPFTVVDIDYDEKAPAHLRAGQITAYLAKQKANHYNNLTYDEILITADTIVWCPQFPTRKLGKPKNIEEAKNMLTALADNTHTVYTSIALTYFAQNKKITEITTDKTIVSFTPLSEKMIEYYLKHFTTLDKAGAYAIQEWIGIVGIRKINGSFYNVMGLPTDILYYQLKKLKVL